MANGPGGPMGGLLRGASQRIVFELSGRLSDIDTNAISQALGHTVSARTGRLTNDVDLRIETGETIIDNHELDDLQNQLQNEVANTHDVVGWRIEIS